MKILETNPQIQKNSPIKFLKLIHKILETNQKNHWNWNKVFNFSKKMWKLQLCDSMVIIRKV